MYKCLPHLNQCTVRTQIRRFFFFTLDHAGHFISSSTKGLHVHTVYNDVHGMHVIEKVGVLVLMCM